MLSPYRANRFQRREKDKLTIGRVDAEDITHYRLYDDRDDYTPIHVYITISDFTYDTVRTRLHQQTKTSVSILSETESALPRERHAARDGNRRTSWDSWYLVHSKCTRDIRSTRYHYTRVFLPSLYGNNVNRYCPLPLLSARDRLHFPDVCRTRALCGRRRSR